MMIGFITGLALGGLAIAASFSSDQVVNGFGPFLALCAGGAIHLTWIIRREANETRRAVPDRRAA
jgi:hypothetical protein